MRQRARVFLELMRSQAAHVADALDRSRTCVGGKFLIAKYRQSLFQAELEPVAAGDAIAGPVVKIFVRYDGFDVS